MTTLVSQATRILRERGGRMTTQRRLILEMLETIGGHPTADEIYASARHRDPDLSASTVYRTLAWLEQAGLVNPRRLGAGRTDTRKECFDQSVEVEHHHFVCSRCGHVIEFSSSYIEQAKAEFARIHQARVDDASLTLHGLCESCRRQEALPTSVVMLAID